MQLDTSCHGPMQNGSYVLSEHSQVHGVGQRQGLTLNALHALNERRWFAVFTLPQNEKSTMKQLALRDVEAFLPTYETVKVWKNRQRVRTVLPLFPTYLFVNIDCKERTRVLQSPGVIHIVGGNREDAAIENAEIDLLRKGVRDRNLEPYRDLVVGQTVRIKRGSMEGVEGVLVRKGNGLRFVLSLKLINQCAAIEVGAEDLEQLAN